MSGSLELGAEDYFLDQLASIDLHHGSYSTQRPYRILEVVGAFLNPAIQAALAGLGFDQIEQTQTGFVARRSEQEAAKRRE